MDREINDLAIIENADLIKQIQKRIELVTHSQTLYKEDEKRIKLAELENQLASAKLSKRKEEINTLQELSLKYEAANEIEKSRIMQ